MKRHLLFGAVFSLLVGSASAQTEATIYTSMGNMTIELREDVMPITAGNFINLINQKFFDRSRFNRVVANFVIQGGDPQYNGKQEPPAIAHESHPSMIHNKDGVLAMANAGQGTATCHYYITLTSPLAYLDGDYAVFGAVTEGMNVALNIGGVQVGANDIPVTPVTVDSIRINQISTEVFEMQEDLVVSNNYPNPFQETTHFNLDSDLSINTGAVQVIVRDYSGRLVQMPYQVQGSVLTLQRNAVASGLYLYEIRYEGTLVKSGKFSVR